MKSRLHYRHMPLLMISIIAGLLILFQPLPAVAAVLPCQTQMDQTFCVQTIKRSAKYPWEFRLTVTINGKLSHWRINCQDRTARNPQGLTEPIKADDWGHEVCRRLKY